MFKTKIYDEPESPNEGACLRNKCQQKAKRTHTHTHVRAQPECLRQEALAQVLARFKHGAKILTHGQQDLYPEFLRVQLAKCSSLCTGGIPEANRGQAL